jgi:hypothetical protein
VFFLALDVGIVALSFVVFHVLFRSLANEFTDLVLGKGWGGCRGWRLVFLPECEGARKNESESELDVHVHVT